jgi:hypothetical protein
MEQNKFSNILAKAQKMMLDEGFNAQVEFGARQYKGNNGGSVGITSSEMAMFERQAFGSSSQDKPIHIIEETTKQDNMSRLPQAIRESFMKQGPLTGEENDTTVLGMAASQLMKPKLNEQRQVQQSHSAQASNVGGIDYSLIKTIIDESVRRHIDEIKSSLLNESATPMFRGMKMCAGNKMQFLDSKGNLYEAELKLKKRAQ